MKSRIGLQSLLIVGVAIALAPPLTADEPANGRSTQNAILSPDEAIQRLKEGNARFAAERPKEAEVGSKRRIELSQGQRPIAAILTCSDSRAAPEIVFDKGLGVLFVVRVAGNVGGPEVYASIEYALAELQTPLIVILGHKNCGAVGAALKGQEQPSEHLQHLVGRIYTGGDLPKDKRAALDAAIHNNVLHQAQLLASKSAIVRDFTTDGRAKIVPAVYDLTTGVVDWLEPPRK